MITKTNINAVLKTFGFGNVKMSDGGMYSEGKAYRDYNNKTVRGIAAGSHGPMTVTNAHVERFNSTFAEVSEALKAIGFVQEGDGTLIANRDAKKPLVLTLAKREFPAYTRSANYDEGYKNVYIVPVYS